MDKEIDLQSPIFAYYVDISNLPRQRAEEQIGMLTEVFGRITNITVWIIPTGSSSGKGRTEIVCIWNPTLNNNVINMMTELEQLATKSGNFNEFTQAIRDWKISKLI